MVLFGEKCVCVGCVGQSGGHNQLRWETEKVVVVASESVCNDGGKQCRIESKSQRDRQQDR